MLALDLFCGAGGASYGLAVAGFEVYGMDKNANPEYPFSLLIGNALWADLRGYDFIWASPPCQAFTAYKRRPNHVEEAPNLIPEIRKMLRASGKPYVIENVPGAPLENPFMLCGSMFDLDVRRHRIFETNFPVSAPPCCRHELQKPRFPQATNRKNLRSTVEVGVWRIPLKVQQQAMGIDWMSRHWLSQAVPPRYSEFIASEWLRLSGPGRGRSS